MNYKLPLFFFFCLLLITMLSKSMIDRKTEGPAEEAAALKQEIPENQ